MCIENIHQQNKHNNCNQSWMKRGHIPSKIPGDIWLLGVKGTPIYFANRRHLFDVENKNFPNTPELGEVFNHNLIDDPTNDTTGQRCQRDSQWDLVSKVDVDIPTDTTR